MRDGSDGDAPYVEDNDDDQNSYNSEDEFKMADDLDQDTDENYV